MIILFTYILFYVFFFGGIVFLGFSRLDAKRRSKNPQNPRVHLEQITVIVPFRDESSRIQTLLDSINNSKKLPARFIFVDDHSNDDSADVIFANLSISNYDIITNSKEGKKSAIRTAMKMVETDFVLTMDADVWFDENYFEGLKNLEAKDMLILPVVMYGKGVKSLFEMDVLLANAFNVGISGIYRPVIASGANLLFRKKEFDEVDSFSKHEYIASGDDVFLLNDFRNANKYLEVSIDSNNSVNTQAPNSWNEFFMQRLRWIAKTTKVKDSLSTVLAVIQFLFSISFYVIFFGFMFSQEYRLVIFFFGIKTMLDIMFFAPYFVRIGKGNRLLFFPIYEVFFPVYSLMLMVGMVAGKLSWKGRKV